MNLNIPFNDCLLSAGLRREQIFSTSNDSDDHTWCENISSNFPSKPMNPESPHLPDHLERRLSAVVSRLRYETLGGGYISPTKRAEFGLVADGSVFWRRLNFPFLA
jgi:hypothetical protein